MTPCIPGLFRPFATVLLFALLVILSPIIARADTQDIAAASRSVVRVALVATDGDSAYFVGHGSGVVVAPGRILTNAHVVELTRSEPNIVIGIIPSEGTKSYGGKVIAFSPGNDLALIAVDNAQLPVATFLAGVPNDGDHVTAIGYPGAVDRAQGMNLEDIIHPMSAVRTSGNVSSGRASKQFDTILHTAPLAAGNSGGPLVDDCGRVIGINSFGSLSDGNDAEYGFAVSDREIASFLRQAGVQVQRSSEACRSMAQLEAAEEAADARDKVEAEKRAGEHALAAREKALAAREQLQQEVITKRENMMALAAVLLALAAVAGGGAVFDHSKGGTRRARWLGGGAAVLFVAALAAFLLRPGFGDGDSRPEEAVNVAEANMTAANAAAPGVGENLCRLDPELSRVTVSDTSAVPFSWSEGGCLNGQTQFAKADGKWTRALVPADEASISFRQYDPVTGRYRVDKFQVDAQTADKARELRQKLPWSGCTADPQRLAELGRLQADIRALLPALPNERLSYKCEPQKVAPGP